MEQAKEDQVSEAERLSECLGREGKGWWRLSLSFKVISFCVGALTLMFPSFPQGVMLFILLGFAILAEVFNYLADRIFGMSHSFRAKLDLQDSLGWEISPSEYSDFLAELPGSVKDSAQKPLTDGDRRGHYFASRNVHGPERALENVEESSWWSKILAKKMTRFCLVLLLITVIGSLAGMIMTVYTIGVLGSAAGSNGLLGIARVSTSFLMLLISLGTVKLTLGYYSFSIKAEKVEKHSDRLLNGRKFDLMEAVKTVHEYHLARLVAPPIPDWIWRKNEKELNKLFTRRREARYSAAVVS